MGEHRMGRCEHCDRDREKHAKGNAKKVKRIVGRGLCSGCFKIRNVRRKYLLEMECREPWGPQARKQLAYLVSEGHTNRTIGRMTGRSLDSVKWARRTKWFKNLRQTQLHREAAA